MIEKKFKTTTGRLLIKIPTDLKEVTLGQMMQLQSTNKLNDLEAISILSGIPLTEVNTVRDINDLQFFADAIFTLSHQITQLYNSDAIPGKITFKTTAQNVTVKVMNNLSIEPAGAFMAASEIIADEINDHIKQYGEEDWQQHFNPSLSACCHVLAHYFYCKVTGNKYNEYEVEAFYEEVKKLKVVEALPIAKHFFTFYPSLSKPKTSYWHQQLQQWKKRLASKHLQGLSISTP